MGTLFRKGSSQKNACQRFSLTSVDRASAPYSWDDIMGFAFCQAKKQGAGVFPTDFPQAVENVSCETRVCQRVRCFTWNIDRPEKVSRETVPPCFAPMFHVEQFCHLFHAFVSHETKVPSLRMAPETVEKLSFFRQSVFWLRRTRVVRKFPCGNFLPPEVKKPRRMSPVFLRLHANAI